MNSDEPAVLTQETIIIKKESLRRVQEWINAFV